MPSDTYHVQIFYSADDEGFIAVVPQLKGCSAFGKTREDAAREIQVALNLWLASAKSAGWTIPSPEKRAPVLRWRIKTKPDKTKQARAKATFRKAAVKTVGRALRKTPALRKKVAVAH